MSHLLFRRDPLLDLYSVSYMWYTPIAVLTVIIVGLIVSYLTHPLKPNEIDPKYLISIGDICCCCFPESVRRFLRFGVDFENYENDDDNDNMDDKNDIEMAVKTREPSFIRSNTISPVPTLSNRVDENDDKSPVQF